MGGIFSLSFLMKCWAYMMNTYLEIYKSVMDRVEFNDEIAFSLINAFSWVVPSDAAIELLAKFPRVVEMGAGKAYWAKLYSKKVKQVRCYDKFPQCDAFYKVEVSGVEVLKDYDSSWTLFICSPQYRSDMVLESLRYFKGNHLIYTGDVNFSLALPSIEAELLTHWQIVQRMDLPNWPNSNNKILEYVRK